MVSSLALAVRCGPPLSAPARLAPPRRFHSLKRDQVPGAGTYDPAEAGDGPKDERDEQGSSAFASSTQRFAKSAPTTIIKGKKQVAEAPAPWKYNVKSQNTWDHPQSDLRTDQTFGSKVGARPPRVCRLANLPRPTHSPASPLYLRYPTVRAAPPQVERFPASSIQGGKARVIPGPGAYHPKWPQEGFRKQQAQSECFGAKEARFALGQRGIFSGANPTPGPGQYDSSIEMNDPLIKRSFNITIG